MKRLRKFLALRSADRKRLLQTGLLLVAINLALRGLPTGFTLRMFEGWKRTRTRPHPSRCLSLSQVTDAVAVASRHVPCSSSCLVRAIAVSVLLARQGTQTQLRIGVAHETAGQFIAHAWVECRGRVLAGNRKDLHRYRVLRLQTVGRS